MRGLVFAAAVTGLAVYLYKSGAAGAQDAQTEQSAANLNSAPAESTGDNSAPQLTPDYGFTGGIAYGGLDYALGLQAQ